MYRFPCSAPWFGLALPHGHVLMSPNVHPSSLLSLILLLCAWVKMPASPPASPSSHLPCPGLCLSPPFIFLISAALLWTAALQEEQPGFQKAVEALTRLAGPSVLQWLLAGELTRAPALYAHTCTSVPAPPCLSFHSCTPTSVPPHLPPWHCHSAARAALGPGWCCPVPIARVPSPRSASPVNTALLA